MQECRLWFMIILSFLMAWVLMIMPWPYALHWVKPQWMSLVLIYWIFRAPYTVGLVSAWCFGLGLDVLQSGLLGQYALAMTIVAFLAHLLRHRIQRPRFWQQMMIVLVLIGFGQLALLLTQWLRGSPPQSILYWSSLFSTILIWPWMQRLLQAYARKTLH